MQTLLQISSARGPIECCWAVAQLVKELIADAHRQGLVAAVIEEETGAEKDTLQSALIHIAGDNCRIFAASYVGTIQWIALSPFRPGHKRKNWFVGVSQVVMPQSSTFRIEDVRMETLKASGPGGQHVNTTESAVRVVHIPTGLSTVARDERSQTANRKRALERLAILVARHEQHLLAKAQKKRWDNHNELVRGNPVRVYEAGKLICLFQANHIRERCLH